MARLAAGLFAGFLVLSLVGWASNSHVFFDGVRFLAVACLISALVLFVVEYVRTPDVPNGDRP